MKRIYIDASNSTIRIEFDYDKAMVDTVKTLPDRQWDKKEKVWCVPLTPFHTKAVLDLLGNFGFTIDPRLYSTESKKSKRKFVLKRDGLYDFQSEAIDFITTAKGRALIADEQGLGKTIEALYWVSQQRDIQRTLVVCPASVIYKWKAEIEKWDRGKSISIVLKGSDELPDTNYVIMSYAIMTRKIREISQVPWDCYIADEAHKLKESKSQRSMASKMIDSRYFLALTGTPVLNRPAEFFNILNKINPAQWHSWWSYVHRYCGARQTYWGLDTSGASNLDELSLRLSGTMIRRLKKDVLAELPDITRTKMPVVVDGAEINNAYRSLVTFLKESVGTPQYQANALVKLNILRQAIGRAKVEFAIEVAEDILEADPDSKVVIYAVHRSVVQDISAGLYKYGVATITGDVDAEERSSRQRKFQETYMPRVMIISSAGGEGIDLYRASTIIFAEREWGPATEEQAEARCHRIGQKDAVEAIYLIAKYTLDEDIDDLIESKRAVIGQIVQQADVKLSVCDDLITRIMNKGG